MSRSTLIALITFVLCLVAVPAQVYSCTCVIPVPPCVQLDRSDAVFVGYISDVSLVDPDPSKPFGSPKVRVTFEVDTLFKGPDDPEIEVVTLIYGGACGLGSRMQVGDTWLVYANKCSDGFCTNSCSRTKLADYAVDEINELAGCEDSQ